MERSERVPQGEKAKIDVLLISNYWHFPSENANTRHHAAAAELAGAEVADLAAQNLRYETLDGTHPTRAGHATIAQAWINCLGSIMPAGEE